MAGDGGDSVANLLEHATNVAPFDGVRQWRVHRYVDGSPKFWAPLIDTNRCFRGGRCAFRTDQNQLNENYVCAVEQNHNIIVTAHDIDLKFFNASDCQDIFTQNQRRVLLISRNPTKSRLKAVTKNLQEINQKEFLSTVVDYDRRVFDLYERVVYIEDLITDWNTANALATWAGLDLQRVYYNRWQSVVQQQVYCVGGGIEYYQSHIDHLGVYRYTQIDNSMLPNLVEKIDIDHTLC